MEGVSGLSLSNVPSQGLPVASPPPDAFPSLSLLRRVFRSRNRSGLPGSYKVAFESKRCDWCKGVLYKTQATGKPQQEDHAPRCKFFDAAAKAARYAEELLLAASEGAGQDVSGSSRQRERYMRESAEELLAAACTANPGLAIESLAAKVSGEQKKGNTLTSTSEMLSRAFRALARGEDPAPITPDSV